MRFRRGLKDFAIGLTAAVAEIALNPARSSRFDWRTGQTASATMFPKRTERTSLKVPRTYRETPGLSCHPSGDRPLRLCRNGVACSRLYIDSHFLLHPFTDFLASHTTLEVLTSFRSFTRTHAHTRSSHSFQTPHLHHHTDLSGTTQTTSQNVRLLVVQPLHGRSGLHGAFRICLHQARGRHAISMSSNREKHRNTTNNKCYRATQSHSQA